MAVPLPVRILVGVPLLVMLPVVSVVGLILLSPLLILSVLLPEREPRGRARTIRRVEGDDGVTFNRIFDVSKLHGCDTRNVQYRWSIFEPTLDEKLSSGRRMALDFGAGSLRDSWELARAGFEVVAVDIDERQLTLSFAKYDWSGVAKRPELFVGPPSGLASSLVFDLIMAFDVLEHLTDLDPVVDELRHRLAPGGRLLVSVPNGRTLRERVGRLMHGMRERLRVGSSRAGVPHVNFKSPGGWAAYFASRGLRVERHEMAIGSLVNDWHFIHSFPLGVSGLARRFPNLERAFCPEWLMHRLDLVDQNLRWLSAGLWGWNLFVLARAESGGVEHGG